MQYKTCFLIPKSNKLETDTKIVVKAIRKEKFNPQINIFLPKKKNIKIFSSRSSKKISLNKSFE